MEATVKNTAIFDKITKCRVQLLIDPNFALMANLVMLLDPIEDYTIKTACTNGEVVKYNPDFFATLTIAEVKGVLAHEAYHCVLLHHTRRAFRNFKMWNIAGDIVINLMLIESGMKLPECALIYPEFKNLSTEQVYNLISNADEQTKKEMEDKFQNGNFGDFEEANGKSSDSSDSKESGKDGKTENSTSSNADSSDSKESGKDEKTENATSSNTDSKDDKENKDGQGSGNDKGTDSQGDKRLGKQNAMDQENKWKINSQLVSQVAEKMSGKEAGSGFGAISRAINDSVSPTLDWKTILRIFADKVAKNEFSWSKPNRRLINRGLYLPSRAGQDLGTIIVVIDTSSSVTQKDLNQVAAELDEIRDIYKCKIIVIYVDSKIAKIEEYDQYDELNLVPYGGGGTDFRPAFKYLTNHYEIEPTCLMYFTDGCCFADRFPEEPEYPVLWVGMRQFTPPFGDFVLMSAV